MSSFLLQLYLDSSELAKKSSAGLPASSPLPGRKEYLRQFTEYLQSATKAGRGNGEHTNKASVTRQSRNTFMEQNSLATLQLFKLLVVIAIVESVEYRALA